MKVLTITEGYPPEPGGGSTYAYEIPKRLSKYGVETKVITGRSDTKYTDSDSKNVSILRLDIPDYKKAGFAFNTNRFRFIIESVKRGIEFKDDYDIYHFHSGMASKVTSWILRNVYKMDKPFVMTFLGTFVGYYKELYPFPISNVLEFFSKRLMIGSRCERYIVVDDGTHADRFLLKEGVPPEKIRKHYQTVDLEKFKTMKKTKKTHKLIGYIGRMDPMKGIDIFLKSLPEVLANENDVKIMMIGSGPLLNELKQLSEDLGISSRIEFIGSVDHSEMPKYMNKFDCLVFTDIRSFRNRDLISLTHCEAMSCGALMLNASKPRKEWRKEAWVQIENPDPNEISTKLMDVLRNPQKYDYLRKNARSVAEKYFGWDSVIKMYYNEFSNLTDD